MATPIHPSPSVALRNRLILFAVLLAGGIAGVVANALLQLALVGSLMPPDELPPAGLLLTVIILQQSLLVALAVGVGLWLAPHVGIEPAPLLARMLAGERPPWRRLAVGLGSGLAAGAAVLLAHLLFAPLTGVAPGLFFGVAVSAPVVLATAFLYGGITEELLMRLGLLTLLVWLAGRLWRQPSFWAVNLVVTILFGLLHLPMAALLIETGITPLIVVQALVLNSVGLLFGWLYWYKGIETAIAAHMGLHVVYTLLVLLRI